jgi:hypothetical protein
MFVILIFYLHSQIFELCRNFEGFVNYLYIMILPCIVVTRHDHTGGWVGPRAILDAVVKRKNPFCTSPKKQTQVMPNHYTD